MKFMNSLGDKARDTLLGSIAALIEKDPKSNLPKIVKLSKLLVSDKSSIEIINNFEDSYNHKKDFKFYVDDLIANTDHKILKNFIVNILGNNLSSKDKKSKLYLKDHTQPRSLIINTKSKNIPGNILSYNDLDKIIKESRKMGIFAFIFAGCEPFSLNYLYEIYEKYSDSLFIPVTEGTSLNENSCRKILKCANVIPLLSYNNTNIDILRKNGIPSFNIKYMQSLFKECNLNDNLSHLKTFSLDFTDSSQKKLITCSLTDLVNTDFI